MTKTFFLVVEANAPYEEESDGWGAVNMFKFTFSPVCLFDNLDDAITETDRLDKEEGCNDGVSYRTFRVREVQLGERIGEMDYNDSDWAYA